MSERCPLADQLLDQAGTRDLVGGKLQGSFTLAGRCRFGFHKTDVQEILEFTGGEPGGLAEFMGGHTPHRTTPHFAAEGDEISQDASDHAGRAVAW